MTSDVTRDSSERPAAADENVTQSEHHTFDTACRASTAVVEAVEETTGVDARELPTLHGVIDPDALDALVCSATRTAHVEFGYAGLVVTVRSDGEITVAGPGSTS